jgi:urea transport system substrate-binding protein
LHSQTGALEISEQSMIEAELLAIDEINARGGLIGRRVEPVVADGRSDWPTFAAEAERLITRENVSVIIGCWTSASRKSVKPVVEKQSHLLIYPMAYEGLEQSPNIVYTGAAANQQVIPAVKWTYDQLKARKYFLVGSDYVWPHCVNAIVKDTLQALGGEVVGEAYITFDSAQVADVTSRIKRSGADVILNSLAGASNVPFYKALAAAGVGPSRIPVLAFGIAEDELRKLPVADMVGDYAAWNYFQSIDRVENRLFVERFRARYGQDRVVGDVMASAYNSVILWSQAVLEGQTDEVARVRRLMLHQSFDAPEGIVSIDAETNHTWRPVSIGRIRGDGQFDIAWTSAKSVRPIPYPLSRTHAQWDRFLAELYQRWGNRWANPSGERTAVSINR